MTRRATARRATARRATNEVTRNLGAPCVRLRATACATARARLATTRAGRQDTTRSTTLIRGIRESVRVTYISSKTAMMRQMRVVVFIYVFAPCGFGFLDSID